MRRLSILLLVVGGLLVATTPANAVAPVHEHHGTVTYALETWDPCPDFDVLFNAQVQYSYATFFDGQGNVVRETNHYSFTGTLHNATDLSKSVPYWGQSSSVSWPDGTFRVTGALAVMMLDGKPIHVYTGYEWADTNTWEMVLHGQWPDTQWPDAVCEVLA